MGESTVDDGRGRVVAPAMVGRSRELSQLAAAGSAPPAVVSIEGEAGVGKTRLVTEWLAGPGTAGRWIMVGRCHPIRESFPLGPVLEALRGVGEELRGRPVSTVAGALRPLLPELAAWLPPAPEPLDDRVAQRHLVFRGLAALLTAVSPAVLVLEDLHWVDEQTADFVAYLLADMPADLTLVLTYRGEDADAGVRALTAKPPAGTARAHVVLAPLDEARTGLLAGAILDADQVSEEFTRYLWEGTSGLPFAVEEVLALFRERGEVMHRGDRWARRTLARLEVPRSIRDSTVERVDRLPAGARRLVDAVAVLRTPAVPAVLAAMTAPGDGGDDGSGDRLLDALAQAVAHGVLAETDGRFGFRHALAAQAVYDDLNAARRIALHSRAADALGEQSPVPLGQVAHHLRSAGRFTEWADAAVRAAAQAARLGDEDEAVRLLADVLRQADLPPSRRAAVAVDLGWAALDTLHARDVIEPLRAVLDLDVPGTARGELRFLLAVILGQAGEDPAGQRQLFPDALPELEHRPDLRTWAMVGLGVTIPSDVPTSESVYWMTRAVELVEGVDDRLLKIFVLGKAGASLMEGGDRSWRAVAERVEALTGGRPRQRREASAYCSLGVAASYLGHLTTADRMLAAGLRSEAAQQNRRLEVMLRGGLAVLSYGAGRWDGLAGEVDAALADVADYATSRLDLELVAGALAVAGGDVDGGEALLRRVTELAVEIGAYEIVPLAATAWARAGLARGDVPAALTRIRTLLGVLDAKGLWAPAGWAVPVAVETLLAADLRAEAERFADRAAAELRELDAPLADPALAHARGLLAGSADDLVAAAEQYDTLPAPYEAARAREAAAAARLAAGDVHRGGPLLREAAAAYQRLGAAGDADRAAGLARRHDVALPARHRGGRRGYGTELSPRERQVAELAASGRTNKEIAAALFVSAFTVDKHMAAIKRKLRVRSRTDLVRLLGKEYGVLP
ncbi:ATP-binding protein [Jiangella alkaliphila]|uniref:AAA ATPase domain-containing protein n=1 Tax=Jiangella alkaliphila TaxID=419479 RepID=A0A1H2L2N9_9ACTN|nr:LuxR family transcriptional regulator [Jiangella alkaliphila]SDU75189.1 AAA ATPase domain-containing protein [Jiangella alkaliphila]